MMTSSKKLLKSLKIKNYKNISKKHFKIKIIIDYYKIKKI